MSGSLRLALLLAGDGICTKTAAHDGAAGLGEQMVMRPVARLKGLKNLFSNSTLFASLPQVFYSLSMGKETQREGGGGGGRGLGWVNSEGLWDRAGSAGGDHLGLRRKVGRLI